MSTFPLRHSLFSGGLVKQVVSEKTGLRVQLVTREWLTKDPYLNIDKYSVCVCASENPFNCKIGTDSLIVDKDQNVVQCSWLEKSNRTFQVK